MSALTETYNLNAANQPLAPQGAISRVVYLTLTKLTERDRKRCGIDQLLGHGIKVSVIELTALFAPVLLDEVGSRADAGIHVEAPENFAALRRLQASLSAADFIVNLVCFTGSIETLRVFWLLKSSGRPYLVLSNNAFPGFNRFQGQEAGFGKLLKYNANRLMRGQIKPLQSFLYRLPPRLLGISAPALIVHGGRKSLGGDNMYPVDASTERVMAHALDYELFLEAGAIRSAHGANTAVYIDQHMGFQRDLLVLGGKMPTTPERFYPRLRRLFDRIEAELNLEVVIAVNPRADIEVHSGLFGSRRVVKNDIAGLIKECRLVIAHCSTAIGFAAMAEKPVMLIATREIYAHWSHRPNLEAFSKALSKPIRFFDDPDTCDLGNAMDIDHEAYERYVVDYVKTPESPDIPFWDIVLDAMNRHVPADLHRRDGGCSGRPTVGAN